MAHGTPDWGVTAGAVTVFQLTDLGELAVRLGSPISHDRRGDVVWWDDFEWSLNKWVTTLSGAGAAAAISGVRARNGQMSCLLTGGSDVGMLADIVHRQSYRATVRGGAEISMHLPVAIDRFDLSYQMQDDVGGMNLNLRYDDVNNVIQYNDGVLGYTTIAAVPSLLTGNALFHTFKIVGDVSKREYVRAIVNSAEYDLRGLPGVVFIAANTPQVTLSARVYSRAGFNDQVYVDDAILTINEPA